MGYGVLRHGINYTGYQHQGYYSPSLKQYVWRYNGCAIKPNGNMNPFVWIQFMAPTKGTSVKDAIEGDPVITNKFVADPRMIKNDSLTRMFVEGALKNLDKSHNTTNSYRVPDVEITKCVSDIRKLLTAYQQKHPEFTDKLQLQANRSAVNHSAFDIIETDDLVHSASHGYQSLKDVWVFGNKVYTLPGSPTQIMVRLVKRGAPNEWIGLPVNPNREADPGFQMVPANFILELKKRFSQEMTNKDVLGEGVANEAAQAAYRFYKNSGKDNSMTVESKKTATTRSMTGSSDKRYSTAGTRKIAKNPKHNGFGNYQPIRHSQFDEVFDKDEYLAHHGILGMKWGVRRYQNADGSLTPAGMKRYGTTSRSTDSITSAEGIQRRLNDLDSAIARNKRHYSDEEAGRKFWTKKGNKLSRKGEVDLKDEMKQKEAYRNADRHEKKAEKYSKNIEKGHEEVERLMKLASESGFDVKTSLTSRSTAEGKDIAAAIIGNAATIGLGSLLGLPVIPIVGGPRSFGTKYKVKDSGNVKTGESSSSSNNSENVKTGDSSRSSNNSGTYEQRRSSYLSENKSRLLKDAKEKGTFDMEFLESNGDTNKYGEPLKGKELMDAYERYIDDEIKRGQN